MIYACSMCRERSSTVLQEMKRDMELLRQAEEELVKKNYQAIPCSM